MSNVVTIRQTPVRGGYRRIKGTKGNEAMRVYVTEDGRELTNNHDIKVVQLIAPTQDWKAGHVFVCTLPEDLLARRPCQPKQIWVMALNQAAVKSYISKRLGRIDKASAGMAQSALGKLMHKISAKERDTARPTARANKKADENTFVVEYVEGDKYVLDVRDNLLFAQLAVRGGKGGVNLALKKAANKVAGLIQHTCKKFLMPGEVTTPFPEIRRRIA
jgi:hypothetical protein